MGFFDGIKQFGTNIADIGKQVVGGVFDAGVGVLNGAKTLITDPQKFASDVGDNVATWGKHIGNSVQSGMNDIGEGFEEAREMGNPGRFLWKALGGAVQIASFGTTDMVKEHVESVTDIQRDELGNVTSLGIDENADAITRLLLQGKESSIVRNMNMETEIKEAIASGDKDRANRVFGQEAWATAGDVAKDVGKAAAAAGFVAATVASGGMTAGAVAVGGSVLAIGGSMLQDRTEAAFNKENVDDDVARRVQSDIDMMKGAGKLSEEQEAMFREVAQAYYSNASYMNGGTSLGEAYMGEGATNQDFKQWLFDAAGLENPDSLQGQHDSLMNAVYVPGADSVEDARSKIFGGSSEADGAGRAQDVPESGEQQRGFAAGGLLQGIASKAVEVGQNVARGVSDANFSDDELSGQRAAEEAMIVNQMYDYYPG